MMEERALTYNRLVTKTQRQFKLAKDFYPNVDILMGDTGEIFISNVGEVPVTQEQLDFMLETIKANEGVYLGDGRQKILENFSMRSIVKINQAHLQKKLELSGVMTKLKTPLKGSYALINLK